MIYLINLNFSVAMTIVSSFDDPPCITSLRMMSPFSAAHTFCACRDGPRDPHNSKVFFAVINMREKKILAKAIEIQNENWGVTTHFPKIIKLQFETKMPNIVMYFKAF